LATSLDQSAHRIGTPREAHDSKCNGVKSTLT
jgi:hypothetical protein